MRFETMTVQLPAAYYRAPAPRRAKAPPRRGVRTTPRKSPRARRRRRHDLWRARLYMLALLLLLASGTLALIVRGRPALRALWRSYGVEAVLPASASAPAVPQSVRLPVQSIAQEPELPNGCEITSAAIALNYLGYDADKCLLAGEYLPCGTPYDETDPEQAYMGTPFSRGGGYYCLTGLIVQAVNDYLCDVPAQGAGHTAVDLSGSTPEELKTALDRGAPVLVWVTTDFAAPRYGHTFTLPDGSAPYSNLHCVVLTGYDAENFYIADPLQQHDSVTALTFGEVYAAMGRRAVAILPNR